VSCRVISFFFGPDDQTQDPTPPWDFGGCLHHLLIEPVRQCIRYCTWVIEICNTVMTALLETNYVSFSLLATAIVISILSSLFFLLVPFRNSFRKQQQKKKKQQLHCPNPSCIRCQRYAYTQQRAQQRLPWIIRNLELQLQRRGNTTMDTDTDTFTAGALDRLIEAVRRWPQQPHNEYQYPSVLFVKGLTATPVVTNRHEDACFLLESSETRQALLDEYSQLQQHTITSLWVANDTPQGPHDLSASAPWHVLQLLNQGRWIPENISKCPNMYRILQQIPNLLEGCLFGNAFLSKIQPGTSIEPHCGPSNVRHRLQYALQLPTLSSHKSQRPPPPLLQVVQERLPWELGRALVFDDSLEHSVHYPTTETTTILPEEEVHAERVLLIVDLWHVDLTRLERQVLQQLYPAATTTPRTAS
jgi:hypothetical protein